MIRDRKDKDPYRFFKGAGLQVPPECFEIWEVFSLNRKHAYERYMLIEYLKGPELDVRERVIKLNEKAKAEQGHQAAPIFYRHKACKLIQGKHYIVNFSPINVTMLEEPQPVLV